MKLWQSEHGTYQSLSEEARSLAGLDPRTPFAVGTLQHFVDRVQSQEELGQITAQQRNAIFRIVEPSRGRFFDLLSDVEDFRDEIEKDHMMPIQAAVTRNESLEEEIDLAFTEQGINSEERDFLLRILHEDYSSEE